MSTNMSNNTDYDDDDTQPLEDSEILREIVMKLVHNPADVWIERKDNTTLLIHVDPSDRGRVIGTKGVTIALLRQLFGIFGSRQKKMIYVHVADAHLGAQPAA